MRISDRLDCSTYKPTTTTEAAMNATEMSQEIKIDEDSADKQVTEVSMTKRNSSVTTLSQRVTICFAAGVLGALAILLFSHVLSWFGPAPKGPVHFPASFEAPGIYRPLFWGGLWGIPFGFLI